MQPFLKLSKVWPWLPHFRVVAELESLSRAARRFGMTSAALSKAIKTLEKLLGIELFDRAGGKLRLNDHGRALLGVVRASMRDIDDAITAAGTPGDSLRIAVDPALATLILPPSPANVELLDVPAEIAPSLLRADVDVAVHVGREVHHQLESVQLATLARSVFGTATRAATLSKIDAAAAFVVLPREQPRGHGAVTCSSLAHAIAWVASGRGAAVLPSAIGRTFGLREIERELEPVALWGTFRRPRAGRNAAAEWCELVRALHAP